MRLASASTWASCACNWFTLAAVTSVWAWAALSVARSRVVQSRAITWPGFDHVALLDQHLGPGVPVIWVATVAWRLAVT